MRTREGILAEIDFHTNRAKEAKKELIEFDKKEQGGEW